MAAKKDKESIEERTERESKPGPKEGLTAEERQVRNAEIIQRKMRGVSWAKLSRDYGISERGLRDIWYAAREEIRAKYDTQDAVDLVKDFLAQYEALNEQLAEHAEEAEGAVKVSAINSQVTVQRDIIALCQSTGLLPTNLAELRAVVNARQMAAKIMAVLEEHDVPDTVIDAMYVALGGEPIPEIEKQAA